MKKFLVWLDASRYESGILYCVTILSVNNGAYPRPFFRTDQKVFEVRELLQTLEMADAEIDRHLREADQVARNGNEGGKWHYFFVEVGQHGRSKLGL